MNTPPALRKRRTLLAGILVLVVAIACCAWMPTSDPKKFYTFMERHSYLTQVVRVGFLLAGRLDEFDAELAQAAVDRMIRESSPAVLPYPDESSAAQPLN